MNSAYAEKIIFQYRSDKKDAQNGGHGCLDDFSETSLADQGRVKYKEKGYQVFNATQLHGHETDPERFGTGNDGGRECGQSYRGCNVGEHTPIHDIQMNGHFV